MTAQQVIRELKRKQGEKSLRKFAEEIGEDAAVLSKVYSGDREPSPAVLRFLGLKKIIRIEYK